MYRLVMTDLDGTLLAPGYRLTQTTIDTVSRLYREKGVRFALASGRGMAGIKPVAEQLGVPVFILPCNGAEIYDENGILIRQKTISYDDMILLKKAVRDINPSIETIVHTPQDWAADSFTDIIKKECFVSPRKPIIGRFEEMISKDTPLLKMISLGTPENTTELAKEISPLFPQYDFYKSQNYILETTAKGANKADGLDFLCKHCGIVLSETIAFGDGYNDIDMLRFAGMSFAMANGNDEAKKAAKKTTLSNMENGVAAALNELFN